MIPIGHTYEIAAPVIRAAVLKEHLADLLQDDDAPPPADQRCGRAAGNWTPSQLGYRQSTIHEHGALHANEREAAEAEQTRRCMRLWQAVVLQAILDISYQRYKKSEHGGTRYEAIGWLEGIGEDDEESRDYVLALAGIEKYRVQRGYRRLKEANYELREAVGNENFAPLVREWHGGD